MKKTKSSLKLITLLLSILLFQSCKIYQSKPITSDEAVEFQRNVKIKTTTNETYKFESLQKEDGKLYGIAKSNSRTAKKLKDRIIKSDSNGKFVKILLPDNFIDKIYYQDKTMSTVSTILDIVLVAGSIATLAIWVLLAKF
jgi:hypothetical protein